jgi:ligand-binding sensor domain-containing protein
MGDVLGGGALIGASNGLFLAREAGGKITVSPAGNADTGRVNHMSDFAGAMLIGGEKGLFVAAAAPGCGGR